MALDLKKVLVGSGAAPTPNQADISDEAKSVLQNQINMTAQSPQDIVNKDMAGTGDAQAISLGQQNQTAAQNDRLGMIQPDFVKQGLANRAKQHFENSQLGLKAKSQLGAAGRMADQQQLAFTAMANKQKINTASYMQKLMDYNEKRAARNKIISSIFSGAGAAAGAIAGGGDPKAIQAGMKAGQAGGPSTATKLEE